MSQTKVLKLAKKSILYYFIDAIKFLYIDFLITEQQLVTNNITIGGLFVPNAYLTNFRIQQIEHLITNASRSSIAAAEEGLTAVWRASTNFTRMLKEITVLSSACS